MMDRMIESQEAVRRRLSAWAYIVVPVVVVGSISVAALRGEQSLVGCVMLLLAWGVGMILAARSWVARIVAYAGLVTLLWLHGPTGGGLIIVTIVEAASMFTMRRALLVVAAVCMGSFAALLASGYQVPVALFRPGFLLFPGAVVFALGRALRDSAIAHEQARHLAQELARANSTLKRNLSTADQLAAAHERTRIARDLHDSLGHCLTTAHVHLELAERAAKAHNHDEGRYEEVSTALANAHESTLTGIKELRRCVAVLRDDLTKQPLSQVARGFLSGFPEERFAVDFEVRGEERRLPPTNEFVLFRTLQEAVTNAIRHSQAKNLRVVLDFRDDGSTRLSIEDDGLGSQGVTSGFGMQGLEERLTDVGGALIVNTRPGAGFRVEATVP